MHCLLACVAERWLLNHDVTYFLGSKSLTGGPLMLIIIKLLTFANNSVDLLSVHTLFMTLKPLSHSAVLQGKVCMHRMSGFRLSGSLSGCSRKSLIPLTACSSQRLNRLHSRFTCASPCRMPGVDGQLSVSRTLRSWSISPSNERRFSMLLIRLCRNCFPLIGVSFELDSRGTDPKCPKACAVSASSDFSPGVSLNDASTLMVRFRSWSALNSVI